MRCSDLGGVCNEKLSAESWDDIVSAMSKHVIASHPDLAKDMEKMHAEDPHKWGSEMKPKWEATPLDPDTVGLDSKNIT